jgi:hypothetical protein
MVAEIIARTPLVAEHAAQKNSLANATRSTGSAEAAIGSSASEGLGHIPARAAFSSEVRSGKYRYAVGSERLLANSLPGRSIRSRTA